MLKYGSFSFAILDVCGDFLNGVKFGVFYNRIGVLLN